MLVAFIAPPQGFEDKFGKELALQRLIEAKFREIGYNKNYEEIETPILENILALPREAFSVWKEENFFAFDLKDYDSESKETKNTRVALRPEGTLPVCRYLAKSLSNEGNCDNLVNRLMYSITCFRNEPVDELDTLKRRAFNQLGTEYIGSNSPEADAEVISYAYEFLRSLGISDEAVRIRINDINIFKKKCLDLSLKSEEQIELQRWLDNYSKQRALGKILSEQRFPNFLEKGEKELITILDNRETTAFLEQVSENLRRLKVPWTRDNTVVRGFNYYDGPVFQIDVLGKDDNWIAEVGGGGRYDQLIGQNLRYFGVFKDVPATGMAFGTERLVKIARLPPGKYTLEMKISKPKSKKTLIKI